MSWKLLAALASILGIAAAAKADDDDYRRARPVRPGPHYAGQPGYLPAYPPAQPGFHGTPYRHSHRDLERCVERALRRQFGHCIDDLDVNVRRGHVEIDMEVRHPVPRGQVLRLLHSLPELYGYQICLKVERD